MPDRTPTRKAPAAKGRRGGSKLTRERVLQVAIQIGDDESLDVLTMRRLATELGVGTMTLYSYFRNKNELLDGVADQILGSLELPPMRGLSVEEGMRLVGHGLRDMMRTHPSVVRLFSSRTTRSELAMRGSYEGVLEALVGLGLEPVLAVHAYGALLVYSLGFSAYELPRPWGRDPETDENAAELRRQRRLFYEALPKRDFPVMVAVSNVLVTLASNEQFDRGLNMIIVGLLAEHRRNER